MLDEAHSRRRADLDGLRGVAIVLIVFFHYVMRGRFYDLGGIAIPIAIVLDSFWSGVDIFFVLSGYLIGGNLIDNRRAGNYFQVFYTRRVLRILPLAMLTIAFSYWFMPAVGASIPDDRVVPWFAYCLFINNFWTASGVPAYGPLGPMWSLAIEEQFYLVVPAFILLLSSRKRLAILGIVILLSPCARLFSPWFSAWDFTLYRLDGFAAGMLVAALMRNHRFVDFVQMNRWKITASALAAVIGSVLFGMQSEISSIQRLAIGVSLYSIATAIIITYLNFNQNSKFTKALSRAYLVKLGRWSYFLYLMHIPILICVNSTGIVRPLVPIVSIVVCLIGASLSWRYIENPLIEYGKKWRYQKQ